MRAEMGYPILVTPVSQLVAYQATRNVIDPERWLNVSDETVRYFLGHYGEFAAPPDPDVADRVLSLPKVESAARRAARQPRGRARHASASRISDEELLLRLTMPQEQVDAMRAAPPIAERPARCAVTGGDPLVRLLREVERRRVDLVSPRPQGRRPGGVAPCVLTTSAASSSTSTARSSTAPATEMHVIPGAREVLERVARVRPPVRALHERQPHGAGRVRAASCAPRACRSRTSRCSRRSAPCRRTSSASAATRASCRSRPSRARAYLERASACSLVDGTNGARVDAVLRRARRRRSTSSELERAARAVIAGARLLTGSYVPAYAGANGPILSRGAMITAAIAKASGARPIVVGKPSRAAVRELERRLGVPSAGDRGRRRRRPPRRRARAPRRLDDGARPQRDQRVARPRAPRPETRRPDRHDRAPSRSCSSGCDDGARGRRSSEPGGPDVLRVVEREVREPGAGEVRIARPRRRGATRPTSRCASAAPRACRRRGCRAWTRPAIVESVGAGVERLDAGDEVMAAVAPRRPEGGAQAELARRAGGVGRPVPGRARRSSRRRRCR